MQRSIIPSKEVHHLEFRKQEIAIKQIPFDFFGITILIQGAFLAKDCHINHLFPDQLLSPAG